MSKSSEEKEKAAAVRTINATVNMKLPIEELVDSQPEGPSPNETLRREYEAIIQRMKLLTKDKNPIEANDACVWFRNLYDDLVAGINGKRQWEKNGKRVKAARKLLRSISFGKDGMGVLEMCHKRKEDKPERQPEPEPQRQPEPAPSPDLITWGPEPAPAPLPPGWEEGVRDGRPIFGRRPFSPQTVTDQDPRVLTVGVTHPGDNDTFVDPLDGKTKVRITYATRTFNVPVPPGIQVGHTFQTRLPPWPAVGGGRGKLGAQRSKNKYKKGRRIVTNRRTKRRRKSRKRKSRRSKSRRR